MHLVGDFNVLEYKINKKIQNFLDLTFQHGLIPIINKPTQVTKRNEYCNGSYYNRLTFHLN